MNLVVNQSLTQNKIIQKRQKYLFASSVLYENQSLTQNKTIQKRQKYLFTSSVLYDTLEGQLHVLMASLPVSFVYCYAPMYPCL